MQDKSHGVFSPGSPTEVSPSRSGCVYFLGHLVLCEANYRNPSAYPESVAWIIFPLIPSSTLQGFSGLSLFSFYFPEKGLFNRDIILGMGRVTACEFHKTELKSGFGSSLLLLLSLSLLAAF